MSEYDLIIIGSGLAGLTAGLFAARHGLSTLVLESNIPGGHLMSIEKIEDFPGFADGIAGYELCPALQRQAGDQGAEFQRTEVLKLETSERLWSVHTDEESHRAKAVIVATGSSLKDLGVPGEMKLLGRGVSHCASCDGPLYNGQTVGVVGGGDSALQEALVLAKYCSKVHIAHRGDKLRAQKHLVDHAGANPKISYLWKTTVEAILGGKMVEKVRVKRDGKSEDMACAGVFAYVGLEPNSGFAPQAMARDDGGHIMTDAALETTMRGIWAIGAVRAGYSGLLRDAVSEAKLAARGVRESLE